MKIENNIKKLVAAIIGTALGASIASAVPYATGLTNTGTAISFRLNESADSVKIIYNSGANVVNLGVRPAGVTTTNLVISGDFEVEVIKTAGAGYLQGTALQISPESDPIGHFEQPVGVAVNTNASSPYFGRIYVANSRNLATAGSNRTAGDGIFVLNPDFTDALGQGTNALTAGFDFFDAIHDTTSPWRLEVGEDDQLYIANFTTNSGTIIVTDPNVATGTNLLAGFGTPGSSPNAFETHGQMPSSVLATGSLSKSNLVIHTLEGDLSPINGLRRFDIGSGPLPSMTPPVDLTGFNSPLLQITRVITDLDRGPDGKFYLLQTRSVGSEGGLFVMSAEDGDFDGYLEILYSSLGDTRVLSGNFEEVDFLRNSYSVKVSPSGNHIAISRNDGPIWIIPLIDGLPDLANRISVPVSVTGPTRDISFDAAGNLYMVNNAIERLRVYSPGGRWVAKTGTDGSFSVSNPPLARPEINITVSPTNLYERLAAGVATISVTRIGDTSTDLTVNLTFGGSAINGVDYETVASSIVIPAGATSGTNIIVPINNTALTGSKFVVVTLAPSSDYDILATAASATITIRDDETQGGAVLFSDDFDSEASSANWTLRAGSGTGTEDYLAVFGFDYGVEGIPPAPHSTGGTTKGLLVTANKNDATLDVSTINAYATGKNFTGDFALRADAYLSIGNDVASTTEHSLVGINHSGTKANRFASTDTEGLWFAVVTDGSNNRGFAFYGTTDSTAPTLLKSNTEFVDLFTAPPWAFAGSPGNLTNIVSATGTGRHWADVEVRQVNNVVTMKVNNAPIFQFTNTYAYKSGTIMVGHNDQFASKGSTNNYTIWDNVRVIDLSTKITNIQIVGANALIDFTTPEGGSFTNYSSTTVTGPYTPDAGTVITTNGVGVYRATTPVSGATKFYQIRRSDLQ